MSLIRNLEWILGIESWRERHWDRIRYCKRYGHTVKESSFDGLHIGKQIMMHRYVKYCDHCRKQIEKVDTPSGKGPGKYGVSFGSEGVCSHCQKKDCPKNPNEMVFNGTTYYPTGVYLYCPINEFEGSESFYEQIKDNDNIITR